MDNLTPTRSPLFEMTRSPLCELNCVARAKYSPGTRMILVRALQPGWPQGYSSDSPYYDNLTRYLHRVDYAEFFPNRYTGNDTPTATQTYDWNRYTSDITEQDVYTPDRTTWDTTYAAFNRWYQFYQWPATLTRTANQYITEYRDGNGVLIYRSTITLSVPMTFEDALAAAVAGLATLNWSICPANALRCYQPDSTGQLVQFTPNQPNDLNWIDVVGAPNGTGRFGSYGIYRVVNFTGNTWRSCPAVELIKGRWDSVVALKICITQQEHVSSYINHNPPGWGSWTNLICQSPFNQAVKSYEVPLVMPTKTTSYQKVLWLPTDSGVPSACTLNP